MKESRFIGDRDDNGSAHDRRGYICKRHGACPSSIQ
jgi:hypothetical protein